MELKQRHLMVRQSGDDVREAQSELKGLGYDVPDDEASRSYYGQGTRDAVYRFQKDNSLNASGIVDKATAEKLTELSKLVGKAEKI